MWDILEYLESRKGLIDAVVVSGGEPTLMPDLKEKIIKLRELGFLIKLDTNGTNPQIIKELYDALLWYESEENKLLEQAKEPMITL